MMTSKQSEFVMRHEDGTFHAIGGDHGYGGTLERVASIENAKRFNGYEFAVNHKNNEGHLRHLPMTIVELRYEVIERGSVPVQSPDWDDFDEDFDREEFARAQGESARRRGRLAQEARQRVL
jgi:hypothetical protein